MADVDSLSIEISASSDEATKKLKELADAMRQLREASKASISKTVGTSIRQLADALRAITNDDYNKLGRMTKALERLSAVSRARIPRDLADNLFNIGQAVRAIPDDAVQRLDNMTRALQRLQNVRMRDVSRTLQNAVANEATAAVDTTTETMPTVTGAGVSEDTIARVNILAGAWQNVTAVAQSVAHVTGTVASNIARIAGHSIKSQLSRMFSTAVGPVKRFASGLSNVVGSFKRILMYRIIRRIIKEITDAIREGTQHLYQWAAAVGDSFKTTMDSAATSLHYFKDSIGAAIAPIIQKFVPMLNTLIDKVVEAINWINQLFAKITGQSTWTRAKRTATEYAETADKAGSAAKEALKYLMPFDELNVLPKESDSGGGGGGGGEDYSQEFETVDLSDKFSWVDGIMDKLKGIWDVFKAAWANEGENTITAAKNALNAVWELIKEIGSSFYEVFTNGTGQHTLETILRIFQNILGTIEAIAVNLRKAWKENDTGTHIVQNVWDSFNRVLEMIEHITASTKEWAWNLDFSPLLQSVEKLTEKFKKLVDVLAGDLEKIWDKVVLPIGKWVIEEAAPAMINLLADAFDFLRAVLEKLEPFGEWLFENLLTPIAEFVGQAFLDFINGLSDTLEKLTDLLDGKLTFREFIDELTDAQAIVLSITAVVAAFVTGLLIYKGVMAICSAVTAAFNGVLAFLAANPIVLVIAGIAALVAIIVLCVKHWDEIKAKVKEVWDAISSWVKEKGDKVKEALTNLKEKVTEITDNIKEKWTTFKENTIRIFTDIKDKVIEAWNKLRDGVKNAINGIIGFVEGMANGVVRGINKVISALNSLNIKIPDWVPGIGGSSFGLNIGYLNEISLPRLAQGGFPEDGLFMANHNELVGGFANGKTAVANNEQIIAGIERGVSNANEDVVQTILTVAGQIVQAIRENDKGISLDDIARGVTRWQNRQVRAYGL